ncbi:MAG: efflux RND transporter periplasmic adaptor subunit [Opitutaceae bacterium]|nr:efflux RND transporter periplasmic adaptor subunit [Opitutaceae bacterium]
MFKFRFLPLIGALLLLSGGFGAGAWWHGTRPKVSREGSGSSSRGREREPLAVRVVKVEPKMLEERIVAAGTVRASERVEIQTEIAGRVLTIGFQEGQPVRKGAILVKLDDVELRAGLERIVQRRRLADLRVERLRPLREGGFANLQDFDGAVTEAAVQKAEEEVVRAQLAKTTLVAPFDGIIGLRNISVGAVVSSSTRFATIESLDPVNVDFFLAERHAHRIQVGQPVRFSVAGDAREYEAEVFAIEPKVDEGTRTLLVRARGRNPDLALRTGSLARVVWIARSTLDALMVPAPSLVMGSDGADLMVVKEGVAERRRVRVGTRREADIEILEGIRSGDQVIVAGAHQVRPGAPVKVLKN